MRQLLREELRQIGQRALSNGQISFASEVMNMLAGCGSNSFYERNETIITNLCKQVGIEL
jgi:hypothetical protein